MIFLTRVMSFVRIYTLQITVQKELGDVKSRKVLLNIQFLNCQLQLELMVFLFLIRHFVIGLYVTGSMYNSVIII